MNKTLQKILRKVETVQVGLLRCHTDDDKKLLLQTRAGTSEESLNCIVANDSLNESLLSKNVNLIQKYKDDYIHISCKVKEEVVRDTATIISMEVLKACWFTRKSKGSVCWLSEKYIYNAMQFSPEEINLAS
jgi:hypothetical protein